MTVVQALVVFTGIVGFHKLGELVVRRYGKTRWLAYLGGVGLGGTVVTLVAGLFRGYLGSVVPPFRGMQVAGWTLLGGVGGFGTQVVGHIYREWRLARRTPFRAAPTNSRRSA